MTLIADDLPDPGSRQKGEGEEAYYAFCLYRDQESPRGYSRVVSELGKSRTLITRWASRWAWVERVRMVDRAKQEEVRRAQVKAAVTMARRQATEAEGYQRILSAPMIALVRRLENPTILHELENLPLADLYALSLATAKLWPVLAAAERDARGAPIQDLSQFYDDETGDVKPADTEDPAEVYDWFRQAAAALEAAGVPMRHLPPGDPTDG